MNERGRRKENVGVVISNKMEKTVTVKVTRTMRHSKFGKVIERSKKYYAHDESDAIELGQRVRIMETRPLSKLKRWRVVEVV
ncbi:MAG: 30S ribosomal protein S17 [uncultured bacterium]|nr:MAG: 30S ribosomal protein S17 [uncultured bacterium]OGN55743.1 MAG: 30S ribosomal protein S17 [Chlamydiae bacterium RIFCSPHIGHO2_01_FULL_44_39]OGN58585.1 MAG: 30S ribosomal protein S17 [Chlamydiae bacterium RIFCSPHIGHO2_02_FULL_45_9]OGN60534.1 MAG: 30S ribosomal protein S17 [Chlamydiae bacterium RIFCSPHIGHO2_12_FULL_44_59]OGN65989.1 MAG: 30S ribosomal protein S17 [Chlamydiae bacterium RIFCSPLOWO2_01_FULL_44_52]OGN68804.1 MAG: 30S ribosomal protein S17 [Chlamydiae bacterium RIFCSPLOWO2_02_F